MPQELTLYEELSAREHLAFFGRIQGLERDELASAVDRSLAIAGLRDRARDRVERFSGGVSPLRAALAVAAKDLRVYARDRVGRLLGFALPAALVLAFGFIMTFVMGGEGVMGRPMEEQLVRIGLVSAWMSQDQGRVWITMIERQMQEAGMAEPMLAMLPQVSEQQYELIHQHLESAEGDQSTGFDFGAAMSSMVPLRNDEEIAPPERAAEVGFMQAQSVGGIAVMMLMFGMVACGSTLLRERETGTLRRLLVSARPLSGSACSATRSRCWCTHSP